MTEEQEVAIKLEIVKLVYGKSDISPNANTVVEQSEELFKFIYGK